MKIKEKVISVIPELASYWKESADLFRYKSIPGKTILLGEGDISKYLYIVSKGCLRIFLIKEDGREVTVQFFFENHFVASMESAFTGKPGNFYLETLEDSEVIMIRLQDFKELFGKHESLKNFLIHFLEQRLIYYSELYVSFILNTPEERYIKLVKANPGITGRIPHHYIATYLGITPVSLSRIRSRLEKRNYR